VTSALEGAVERGTGRGLRAQGVSIPLAGKSGTSSDWRDGWFLAYTPALAMGVWVGYDDARSIGLTGSRVALPIVARFLRAAIDDEEQDFPVPDGIEVADVNSGSGLLAGWGCGGEEEVFLEGTAPTLKCQSWWDGDRWVIRLDQLRDGDWGDLGELLDEKSLSQARDAIRELARQLRREARRLSREH
jgi:membrane carboxypeptidase/penicillin-binding protein